MVENEPVNEMLQKSGSWARAFGRGVGGVFLLLLGIGIMFFLNHYFTNLDEYGRGIYYGGDPLMMMLYLFVMIPAIALIIGGSSIYYGIRIISKT